MRRRVPDTAKVNGLTGWRPCRTLDDILRETLAEAAAEYAAEQLTLGAGVIPEQV